MHARCSPLPACLTQVLPPIIYASCNGQPVAPALGGPSQVQLAVARGLLKQTVTLDPGRSFSAQQMDDCTAFAGAMLSQLPCSRGASSSQSAASFGPIAVLQLLYVAREHRRCGGPLAPLEAAAFQLVLVQQLMHKRAVAVAMAGAGAGGSEEARAARAAVEQRAREGKRFAAIKWIQHWGKAYLPGPATWLGMAAAATAVAAAMGYDEGVQRAVAAAAGVGGSLFHCHQSTHSMAAEAAMHPSLHVQATISLHPSLHEAARPFGLALRPGGRGPGEDEVSLVQPPLSITFASRSVLGEAPFHDMLGGGSVDMPASQRHLWHGAYPSMPRIPLMVPFNTGVVGKVPLSQASDAHGQGRAVARGQHWDKRCQITREFELFCFQGPSARAEECWVPEPAVCMCVLWFDRCDTEQVAGGCSCSHRMAMLGGCSHSQVVLQPSQFTSHPQPLSSDMTCTVYVHAGVRRSAGALHG